MSLYDGWNGLNVGQAVTNGIAARQKRDQDRWDALGRLIAGQGSFADSIYGYYRKKGEDSRARQAGLAIANGMGMENAAATANGMSGEDYLKYVLGRQDALDAEKRAEDTYQAHWEQNAGREDDVSGRTRDQTLLDAQYNKLWENFNLLSSKSKNGLQSQADINELNDARANLIEFVKEHPEYGNLAFSQGLNTAETEEAEDPGNDLSGIGNWSREQVMRHLNGLRDPDGKVDPKKIGEFLDAARTAGVWHALKDDGSVADVLSLISENQKGISKLLRKKGNLTFGGVTTNDDVAAELRRQAFLNRVKTELDALTKWSKGEGVIPTLSDDVKNT